MLNSPYNSDYLPVRPIRDNTIKKIRRLFYAAILVASAISHGCATQQKAKESTNTPKKYEFTKKPEIKVVKRDINFCAVSIDDVKAEAKRCVSNVIINKESGLHCLKCTTQVEQVQY